MYLTLCWMNMLQHYNASWSTSVSPLSFLWAFTSSLSSSMLLSKNIPFRMMIAGTALTTLKPCCLLLSFWGSCLISFNKDGQGKHISKLVSEPVELVAKGTISLQCLFKMLRHLFVSCKGSRFKPGLEKVFTSMVLISSNQLSHKWYLNTCLCVLFVVWLAF